MSTTHTPGPWEIGKKENEQGYVYCDDSLGSAVCQFDLKYTIGLNKETKKANGRLISASPELLECLQDFVNSFNSGNMEELLVLRTKSESIINKALNQ